MATLRRMGLRTLVRIGIEPGRALTNAQPTTKELTDGRAEQLAYIRQRMIENTEHPSAQWDPGSIDRHTSDSGHVRSIAR
jgi:hypothetical protein